MWISDSTARELVVILSLDDIFWLTQSASAHVKILQRVIHVQGISNKKKYFTRIQMTEETAALRSGGMQRGIEEDI